MGFKIRLIAILLFLCEFATAQDITICSWNLKDFGKSKTDQTLDFIKRTIESFDVIAIQEVVAGVGGPQAVKKLVNALNAHANIWKYEISPVTTGKTTKERYAFLWKTTKIRKMGLSWLDSNYRSAIEREPFMGKFTVGDKVFTLINFHAIPKTKNPETEIKYLKFFPKKYPTDNLIFCGDFNLPQSHSVFSPLLTLNFVAALVKQKTTLRQKCIADDCLASEYDNFYFNPSKINALETGVLHFYRLFEDLKSAKKVSDHLPIYMKLTVK